MNEIEETKIKLEAYKNGTGVVNDVIGQMQTIAFNADISARDLLQARFDDIGTHVTCGENVRELVVNLIFTDA